MPTEKFMKVLSRRFIDSKKFKKLSPLRITQDSPTSRKVVISELGSVLQSHRRN